jgi:hypothetical protein
MRCGLEIEAKTYGDIVKEFRWHEESKSLGPDGVQCTSRTVGILQRAHVVVHGNRYVGKETDRRWEQGEDFSLLKPLEIEYIPNETERLGVDEDLRHALRLRSIRRMARLAGVSLGTIRSVRRGHRIRKSRAKKIWEAVKKDKSQFH